MHPSLELVVPSRKTILHAYRALLRSGLIAVQYSTPARYAIRDKLRDAFRKRPASSFDKTRIDNTIEFLLAAGHRVGIEHKIVRNLCLVHYWQNNRKFHRLTSMALRDTGSTATYYPYYETIRFLNESAGLDLV